MHRLVGGLALAALMALAPAAHAETPLSDAEVRGFIGSLAAVERLAARHEAAGLNLDDESSDAAANPISAAVRQMRTHSALGEFEGAMKRHGFADAAHWSQVGDRVYRAYFALAMEREAPQAQSEMQQALTEVERDPNLSADDKRAMREMMAGAMAGMRSMMQSSEADKAVVSAYMELLEQAWRSE